MADKQIIIDGVNVSGCECFYINDSHKERKECINPYCKGLCKDNLNCYYKQLKRKEQECEELKQTLTEIKEIAEPFCNACKEFELKKNCRNCEYYNYNNILQKISEVEDESNRYNKKTI